MAVREESSDFQERPGLRDTPAPLSKPRRRWDFSRGPPECPLSPTGALPLRAPLHRLRVRELRDRRIAAARGAARGARRQRRDARVERREALAVVERLLQAGADASLKDTFGRRPATWARRSGYLALASTLEEAAKAASAGGVGAKRYQVAPDPDSNDKS